MNDAPPNSETLPVSPAAPPLGGHVVRGSIWMMMNTVVGKGASLIAQIVLAWVLTKEDFGVFATASSAAVFATFLRDGGVRDLLIQRQAEYPRLLGPIFWLACWMNLLCGLLVVLIGAALAFGLQKPIYFWMLLIIGSSVPINTLPSILSARLNIELRFQELSIVQIAAALVRYGGSVGFAIAGFGPMAFVLPLPAMAIVEWIMLRRYVKDRPWREPPHSGLWWDLLKSAKWILLGTLGVALVNMGNYSVVRIFVNETVVGIYFFAYQIVAQVGILVAANMNQILFAAFARIDEPERLRRALDKSLRQLMFFAVPTGLVLIPVFPGLERWLWQGRWDSAVPTVLIIAVFYPLTVVNAVPYAALKAWGRFRAWALLLAALGVAVLASGMLGAWLGGTAEWIGLSSSVTLAIGCMGMVWLALRRIHVGLISILKNTLPAYLVGLIAAGAGWLIDSELSALPHMQFGLGALGRATIAAATFTLIYGALAIVLLRPHIHEAIQVLPARLRNVAMRITLLREAHA